MVEYKVTNSLFKQPDQLLIISLEHAYNHQDFHTIPVTSNDVEYLKQ